MIRRFLLLSLVLMLAFRGSAFAARGDAVSSDAAKARATFTTGMKDAEKLFVGAITPLMKSLKKRATAGDVATNSFGAAFGFYVATVKKLSDNASTSIATDAAASMAEASDETLAGAVAGDGGSLDTLTEFVEQSLESARRRLLTRTRAFAKTLNAATSSIRGQHMSVLVPSWPLERRAAPTATGVLPALDEPIRLLGALATRLDTGFVIVTVVGGAPDSVNGNFDVRLVSGTEIKGVGNFLAAGGMPVDHRTWTVTVTMNGPPLTAFADGNRLIEFGVDPFNGGLAGLQPGRMLHAGVIGIE